MCGIVGQFRQKSEAIIIESDIKKMLDIIIHRGPDGEGVYISEECALGMRRLSIIDLEGGWQPLYNEDRSVVCVCNGEIYNYIELQSELKALGHRFRTKSDAEVILHLYEEYDVGFVNKLNGMFAIALFDIKKHVLHLYRDRLGKKPLYYTQRNGKLYFGSEIKSIISCEGLERKCNYKALDYILTYNYIPSNLTAFEGIYKLMPGEHMLVAEGNVHIDSYWELPLCAFEEKKGNAEMSVLTDLADLLDDAVRIRLRSDVPVGAFLSGGVDSSYVVASASSYVDRIKTFSIGFSESGYDESKYSREVAELLHTDHHEQIVDSHFFDLLPKTIWLNDNPHGDISFLPSFVLAEITAQQVKTVLTGDGGDEIFGGYDKYVNYMQNKNNSLISFFESNSVFSQSMKKDLYIGEMKKVNNEQNCLSYIDILLDEWGLNDKGAIFDRLNVLLHLETRMLLEGNNLVKPDRMGMGNSLEARMPLMDFRVVEYVSSLPSIYKIKDGITKYVFKKIAVSKLPKEIVYRKKQMFTVPIGEWFKDSLKGVAYDILLDERTVDRRIFDYDVVRKMLEDHVRGRRNYTRQLRLLIVIELWHRLYIDKMSFEPPMLSEIL